MIQYDCDNIKVIKNRRKLVIFFTKIILLSALYISVYHLHVDIFTRIFINNLENIKIDYEDFREMDITIDIFDHAERINNYLNKNLDENYLEYRNYLAYLSFYMFSNNFNISKINDRHINLFIKSIPILEQNSDFNQLYEYNKAVFSNLKYFPIPNNVISDSEFYYEDSWYTPRSYGGDRLHEGTDIFDSYNISGRIPIISITDGVIENMGWLEKGGYRIGIRSESGGYFYYAHLFSFASNLQKGDKVLAGQLLGFMGDSGYGEEGTVGQFPVHLHMGIYVEHNGEMSVNPYNILRILQEFNKK